jgi:hypothetical protein
VRGWDALSTVSYLNTSTVRHALAGFADWAIERGAVNGATPESESRPTFSQEWRAGREVLTTSPLS